MDPVNGASLGLAVVSLSFQIFGGCVEGFVLLSTAHNLGKDAQFLLTLLNAEEYRFVLWAEAVGLTQAEPKYKPGLNVALADALMLLLQDKLDIKKLRERYGIQLVRHPPSSSHTQIRDTDLVSAQGLLKNAVSDETRAEILARAKFVQKCNALPKRLWWAAVDKDKFEKVVKDVEQIVNGLWALVEPLQQAEQAAKLERVLSTIIQVSDDVKGLRDLQEALPTSSLTTAASLRSTRVQIGDDDPDGGVHPNVAEKCGVSSQESIEGQPILPEVSTTSLATWTPTTRRDALLPPLNSTSLTKVKQSQSNPVMAFGLYLGKPVLVEYKRVPTNLKMKLKRRVENLAALLSQPKDATFLTLKCLGFFEKDDQFVFIFEYPAYYYVAINTETIKQPITLLDVLSDVKTPPPSVTARVQLALGLCRTVQTLHTARWLHKNLRSENVMLFPTKPRSTLAATWTQPYITGFAFSRLNSASEISEKPQPDVFDDIYRHPRSLGQASDPYESYMDLYSLGVILVEIAEWRPFKDIIRKCVDLTDVETTPSLHISSLEAVQPWLVKNMIQKGHANYRMGEVYGNLLSLCLAIRPKTEIDTTVSDLSEFQQAVSELGKCYI